MSKQRPLALRLCRMVLNILLQDIIATNPICIKLELGWRKIEQFGSTSPQLQMSQCLVQPALVTEEVLLKVTPSYVSGPVSWKFTGVALNALLISLFQKHPPPTIQNLTLTGVKHGHTTPTELAQASSLRILTGVEHGYHHFFTVPLPMSNPDMSRTMTSEVSVMGNVEPKPGPAVKALDLIKTKITLERSDPLMTARNSGLAAARVMLTSSMSDYLPGELREILICQLLELKGEEQKLSGKGPLETLIKHGAICRWTSGSAGLVSTSKAYHKHIASRLRPGQCKLRSASSINYLKDEAQHWKLHVKDIKDAQEKVKNIDLNWKLLKVKAVPEAKGAYGKVWRGDYSGQKIAIKEIRGLEDIMPSQYLKGVPSDVAQESGNYLSIL
ncbi:hypothetical protein CERSUDRAFT_74180 [Gelatoporia subvermispora B]|uniref:Protein kinase domain-containing protein n=1 Tax=Ceriporiopsis subvermispora (strain B) TaxID=914234 RepID=M2QYH3_CERS8|nr:hypothetical protein CERSUDRAFT_74180 [Gelatoporia subvermispora B]